MENFASAIVEPSTYFTLAINFLVGHYDLFSLFFISLVQGKKYFECPPNHGIFVRQTQLTELSADPAVEEAIQSPRSGMIPPSSGASKIAGLRKLGSQSQTPQVYITIDTYFYQ